MAYLPTPNQSVSGTVGASVIGKAPVLASQDTTPWVITGSVQGVANQSVSGTVQTDVRGSVATVIIGGSIAASFTPPANQSVSGTVDIRNIPSVVAFQAPGSILAVSGSFSPAANQSVSGTVQVDVRNSVAAVIIGGSILTTTGNSSVQVLNFPTNQSVSGAVSVSNFPTTQNVSGSVVATQGTNPWTVVSSLAGGIFPISGSVAATVTNTNLNVSGSVAAWLQSTNASIITVGAATGNSSVQVLNFPTNQSVSGTVGTTQSGTWISSIVNTVPSSVIVGASAFGTFPVTQQTTPWDIAGSIVAFQAGTQITSISGQVTVVSSLAGGIFPVSGSVATVMTAWQAPSIVGTYQEDAAHTSADRGIFVLAVRNDTVASFAGANGEYSPNGVDSAGRTVTKPFAPGQASLIAHTSLVSAGTTASVQVFPAPGAGLKNYITDFNISNTSATTTLVRFGDRDRSVLAQTIAPGGGGSNFQYATPMVGPTANLATGVEILTSASVVYVTVAGFKAP